MVTDHALKPRQVIVAAVIVSLVTWYLVLTAIDKTLRDPLPFIGHIGIVILVFVVAWNFFTKIAWRWRFLRSVGLVTTPDLNGRWEGAYTSKFKGTPTRCALEIRQTLLTATCIGYTPDSIGESYSTRVLSDSGDLFFKLAFLYHARRDVGSSIPGDEHTGVSILTLIDGSPKQLRGYYFNDRDPEPQKGKVDYIWKSKKLTGLAPES